MNKKVVLDIETKNTFQDVGGYFTDKLQISVVCAYFYETDTWESFTEETLGDLFKKLERCDGIIGYNTIGFDCPVMNNYYPGDLLKVPQIDLLAKINETLGFRIKLDDVAGATLGTKKSGHGLLAVQWWKEGRVQDVIDYCMQDVKVTKEVYEFGKDKGYILFDDRTGERRQVFVDFSDPEDAGGGLNLTMGF
ncbi:helicase [Candidatus Uhrbacteria bacterium CG_4_9_14_0_2_um_filter_41_50]|uniref:Helicase n=1 Tax=Candidatus Uhrbacteria bacterium CG_4_9_14_0_2_um_filter_41_50 TaxID=1975031 RepID=A0A2M8EP02_9BACT|nr:MAG: helicase [Candidatus Uhrbacteria bacterium CG_4_10_14_3_um_filter_41_21]PIZ55338.1 MAG: helicase [Candidatus Uhrbacteria bacterium CG_4_10_14_0_2_um_filter_41_21]PJB84561.1 MAG: helicase [Candidatus Uhrbacteria bacterium CG_4_9_14_0_8_um_filter_41_16]PJC24465.1 MAG: helicase [Candidatus Uhrbacteria bacterium CG_4_9_14_0_2_um_filter_41_50]PJE75415.1 MAG: helicase [Candidatus Uhrbacteria bacterium CG10_big_fil_rev_8_21_14_0_10_41_26]